MVFEDRIGFNCQFIGVEEMEGWHSDLNAGRKVLVFPPASQGEPWLVAVPSFRQFVPIMGEDAEERAFSVAAGYVRQKD